MIGFVEPGHQPHQAGLAGQCAPQQDIEGSGLETEVGVIDPDLTLDGTADVLQRE
ncbi:hypothetical protein D3C84_641880 [compost metagenome]